MKVFRVQDHKGRGPFKPGFTRFWLDPSKPESELLPSMFDEFPNVMGLLLDHGHQGCACTDLDTLKRWLNAAEMSLLKHVGYRIVSMNADKILAQSKNQVLFWRKLPFNTDIEVIEDDRLCDQT